MLGSDPASATAGITWEREGCLLPLPDVIHAPHGSRGQRRYRLRKPGALGVPLGRSSGDSEDAGEFGKPGELLFHIETLTAAGACDKLSLSRTSQPDLERSPALADELYTVAEVAGLLKLADQTIRNWIDAGAIPAVRIGRRVRIRRAVVLKILEHGLVVDEGEAPPEIGTRSADAHVLPRRPNHSGRARSSPGDTTGS